MSVNTVLRLLEKNHDYIIFISRIMTFSEEDIRAIRQEIIDNKRPRYLYKYRGIKSAIVFLKNNSIYFSNYKDFNDPFESACKKIIDYTPKDYFEAFLRWGVDTFSAMQKLEEIASKHVNSHDLQLQVADLILNGFSYFCMAKEPDNILMWSHYADSHEGVCFKFDLLQDNTFLNTVPVDYNSAYLEFDTLNGNPMPIITRKSSDWSYEQEHRTIATDIKGLHQINKEVLVEIIFGCRTHKRNRTRIRSLVRNNGFNRVSFSEAVVNPEAYKLDIQPFSFSKR